MKGKNEYTSAIETNMSVVTLTSQKLKYWQKIRLKGIIGKWPEAQRLATPQINSGLAVVAVESFSVSQAKRFLVRGANIAMEMNGTIAGYLATGRKKFTARQWAVLIGFCGVETRKQVQNIWMQIEKARDATEVRNFVVTAIKEQQVDVYREFSRVWFGDNVAEEI